MYISKVISLAFVTVSGFACATDTTDVAKGHRLVYHVRPQQKASCAQGVHMIAVSGIGSGMDHQYGTLINTVKSVKKAIPKSTSYAIDYNKKSLDYDESTADGQRNLVDSIERYAKSCPHTPIVLLGYSAGGIITSNSLCGKSNGTPAPRLPMDYTNHVIAAVTLGDETFVPHKSWDRGTCKQGHGVSQRSDANQCKPWASKLRVYCDAGDDECCSGGKISDNNKGHHTYTVKYDRQITQFIVNKYKAKKHHGH